LDVLIGHTNMHLFWFFCEQGRVANDAIQSISY
jgi:hypothetical protein